MDPASRPVLGPDEYPGGEPPGSRENPASRSVPGPDKYPGGGPPGSRENPASRSVPGPDEYPGGGPPGSRATARIAGDRPARGRIRRAGPSPGRINTRAEDRPAR